MGHQYFIFTVSITKKAPAQRDFLGDGIVPSRELAGTEGIQRCNLLPLSIVPSRDLPRGVVLGQNLDCLLSLAGRP